MPLIMDDGLDMDELFGEEPTITLPPVPTAKGLVQRVEDLRLSGCCTRLAWSKLGCVAYITRDSDGVAVRNILCDPDNGKWVLSSEFSVPQSHLVAEGQQLAHISWNHTGSELAVVDVMGRISVFSIVVAMNRWVASRLGVSDQEDDLGAIAGLAWLNPERQFPLYRPAVMVDGQYQYIGSTHKSMGPFHPLSTANKSALICVTRGGTIRLLYQQIDNRWLEVVTELESISTSNDLLSHASFCSDQDNSLLLVVRTVALQYRLHRVSITWASPSAPKPAAQPQALPSPKISVTPIKTAGSIIEDSSLFGQVSLDGQQVQPQLSQLEMIPVAPQPKNSEPTYPTVLAIFSHIPETTAQDDIEAFSTFVTWELRKSPQTLHESFDHMASKKKSASSANQEILDLQFTEVERVNKVVLSVQQNISSTGFASAFGDGTVEFRDRASLKAITIDDDPQAISSMTQVGFSFLPDEPCLHVALSPNLCQAVCFDMEGHSRLKTMQYTQGPLGTSDDDPRFMPVVVALTLLFVYSCTHHNNIDDVLATIQQILTPDFEAEFLSEIVRALSLSVDHSADPQHEKLFRNPVLQRCLSTQNSLGYKGDHAHRSLTAKIAWSTLHLRLVALTFAFTFNTGAKPGASGPENDLTRPEVLQSLFGVIKWSIDLMNFLVDELMDLANVLHGRETDREFVQQVLLEKKSCALQLVLASVPRTFLRYNMRGLRGLSSTSNKGMQFSQKGEQKQAFTSVIAVIDSSVVKVTQFERLLSELDSDIKTAYQSNAVSDGDRALAEKRLLIKAEIPPGFMSVVNRLLTTTLNWLRKEIDPAALYFADYRWLGLSDDKATDAFRESRTIDALRKVVLSDDVKLRRCTRCCAYMEDVPHTRGGTPWGANMQKMCFCGSMWMLVGPRKKKSPGMEMD